MVKILSILLCAALLCPSARASEAQQKDIALTFDLPADSAAVQALLSGLREQEIPATFFLRGKDLSADPALAREILEGGHEIGISSYHGQSLVPLSRRAIAAEFADTRVLLPPKTPVRFLRPPEMAVSDGVRQVAEVTGLSIIHWRLSEEDDILQNLRDGDILLLPGDAEQALPLIHAMAQQGFRFLTLTELARRKDVHLRPGRIYDHFSSP